MQSAFEANQIPAIEYGALGYMLSKQGYLGDRAGHWHPHIIIYVPPIEPAAWGANLAGSPIFGKLDPTDRVCVFVIPVGNGRTDRLAPMIAGRIRVGGRMKYLALSSLTEMMLEAVSESEAQGT